MGLGIAQGDWNENFQKKKKGNKDVMLRDTEFINLSIWLVLQGYQNLLFNKKLDARVSFLKGLHLTLQVQFNNSQNSQVLWKWEFFMSSWSPLNSMY